MKNFSLWEIYDNNKRKSGNTMILKQCGKSKILISNYSHSRFIYWNEIFCHLELFKKEYRHVGPWVYWKKLLQLAFFVVSKYVIFTWICCNFKFINISIYDTKTTYGLLQTVPPPTTTPTTHHHPPLPKKYPPPLTTTYHYSQ